MGKNISPDLYGIFLSIAVHALVGNLVVFSMPLQALPDRPGMTFWGAFLSSIEHPFSALQPSAEARADMTAVLLYFRPTDERVQKSRKPGMDYSGDFQAEDKRFQKTTFLREEPPASVYTYPYSSHYQKTKVEYQPLRFQPYYLP